MIRVINQLGALKVLGIYFQKSLKWNHKFEYLLNVCYNNVAFLKKLKRFTSC